MISGRIYRDPQAVMVSSCFTDLVLWVVPVGTQFNRQLFPITMASSDRDFWQSLQADLLLRNFCAYAKLKNNHGKHK